VIFKNKTSSQKRSKPRLHLFLGAGGVGKTTLSAGFALALAQQGRHVGLMSIDPAKRLQGALGLTELPETGATLNIPNCNGSVRASVLHIGDSLKRWVNEAGLQEASQERLYKNTLFRALAERLATATDTFAAVRMAEWPEREEGLTDLVVDTAPGIHAIDFLSKPEKLSAFLDGKLIEWLKWFAAENNTPVGLIQRVVKGGAKRVLEGLSELGGQHFMLHFAEFLILLDDVFARMMTRLEFAGEWLRSNETQCYVVTSVRYDAVQVAWELSRTLKSLKMKSGQIIINRAFPEDLANDKKFNEVLGSLRQQQDASFFANYLDNFIIIQRRVQDQLSRAASSVLTLPVAEHLDAQQDLRQVDLMALGQRIIELSGEPPP
jgi:anion-transporting  ArsA/GET3 family ATPase